jgi:hypothetical protein
LAIGKPVALDARAEDRDTRGFISMTTMRPSAGIDGPLHVGAAGLDADLAQDVDRARAHPLVLFVGQVRAGATVIESPVCTPIGSIFSIEQMMMQLSALSRTTSISYSFQPSTAFLDQHLGGGRQVEAAFDNLVKFLAVIGDAAAGAGEGEGWGG